MARESFVLGAVLSWWGMATGMDVHTIEPILIDTYCARGYPICSYTMACRHGYMLDCSKKVSCEDENNTCEDFGMSWRKTEWNDMCGTWENVKDRYECCQCVGTMLPVETLAPSTSFHRCYDSADRCPDSYSGSCCFTRLDCPSGYTLSDAIGICGQTDCGMVENYASSELNYMGSYCNGIFPGDRVLCQTCLKDPGETTTTSLALLTLVVTTTGAVAAPTSDYVDPFFAGEECTGDCRTYPMTCPDGYRFDCQAIPCAEDKVCTDLGEFYQTKTWSDCKPEHVQRYECCRCARSVPASGDWELIGARDNGACRGTSLTDNSPSYYTVHESIYDIAECKLLCLDHFPSCKGIEYSYGRCEIWSRPDGIFLSAELSGFTCLRFGWAAKHLVPVDGGDNRACRGSSATDNSNSYYRTKDAATLEVCTAMCTAAPLCYGIEFSSGRCEIWVQPIRASTPREGFTCLAYDPAAIPVFTEKNIVIP